MIEARGNRAAILRAYNFFRPLYGSWAALLERQAVARGLELAQVQLGERVLEVAVGTAGAFTRLRQQAGTQGCAAGVDLAPRMLAATRRRIRDAILVRADPRSLPPYLFGGAARFRQYPSCAKLGSPRSSESLFPRAWARKSSSRQGHFELLA